LSDIFVKLELFDKIEKFDIIDKFGIWKTWIWTVW